MKTPPTIPLKNRTNGHASKAEPLNYDDPYAGLDCFAAPPPEPMEWQSNEFDQATPTPAAAPAAQAAEKVTPPAPKAGATYSVENGRIGIWRTVKDTETKEKSEVFSPLCNFNAWIVADVLENDGEETSRKISIAGKLDNGMPLPAIEIDAEDFEAMKWPVAKWGARVSIDPYKGSAGLLRHALQELSKDRMEDKITFTHTGWETVNGKRVFLYTGGAIGDDNVSVNLADNFKNYRFPTDNAISARDAMRESIKMLDIAPGRVSMPIWAAMYLAPLSEIITPAFTLSVEGGSGVMKTSFCAAMLNHFGPKFGSDAMPADWQGTANSLERLCFHGKDVPIVIDDFCPSSNAMVARAMQDAVGRITRAAGNRQGRSRLDANSKLKKTFVPRGVVIMTAERKALGKSVNSRILTVDVEPGDVNPKKLGVVQMNPDFAAYAMRGYIEMVARDYDQLSKRLPARVAELRADDSDNGHHKRLPNVTAILYTAFELAMQYAVEVGAISREEAQSKCDACLSALRYLEAVQSANTDAEDPAVKYLDILASLIAQEKAHVAGKGEANAIGSILSNSEKLGWHDGEYVYLLPGAYNLVCRFVRDQGNSFPSDEPTLRKELAAKDWLGGRDPERLTMQQRVPGSGERANVTVIKMEVFAEKLDSMGMGL